MSQPLVETTDFSAIDSVKTYYTLRLWPMMMVETWPMLRTGPNYGAKPKIVIFSFFTLRLQSPQEAIRLSHTSITSHTPIIYGYSRWPRMPIAIF